MGGHIYRRERESQRERLCYCKRQVRKNRIIIAQASEKSSTIGENIGNWGLEMICERVVVSGYGGSEW